MATNIPKLPVYTGKTPVIGQVQPEFNINRADKLTYDAQLFGEEGTGGALNTTIEAINTASTEIEANAAAAEESAQKAEDAAAVTGYKGEWYAGAPVEIGDIWGHQGSEWRSLTGVSGVAPVDGSDWREILGVTSLPKYTDLVFDSVADMISNAQVNSLCKLQSGSLLKRTSTSNGSLSDFIAKNKLSISDFITNPNLDSTVEIESFFNAAVNGALIDIDCIGSPSVPPRKCVGDGFITGIITITGSGLIADIGDLNCSSLSVSGYQYLQAGRISIDGEGFSEHGIETETTVSDIFIDKLFIKNAGGTVQYKSATSFKGMNCKKLQLNFVDIRDCSYSGLTTATVDGTLDPDIYSYESVILGNVYIDGCGNTTNPAGDNQHHGFYIATAKKITFNTIEVKSHQRGYGGKFGSSVERNMGHISGGKLIIDGITNGRGGLTFTEPYESFTVGGGRIHGTDTTHCQWMHNGQSGDTNFGSMIFEESETTSNNVSLDLRGDLVSLNLSQSTFKGWADSGIRRGISDALLIRENATLGKLICHGTIFDTLINHPFHGEGSNSGVGAIVEEISVVAPIIKNCGGIFNFEYNANSSSDVQSGMITGIAAELGTLTNAWVLPARGRLQFEVRENTIKSGGSMVRLNDLSYSRMSNITQFDTTHWIDSDTGVSITEATFDMQFPDSSLGDGFIGKVWYGGAWKDYGAIQP